MNFIRKYSNLGFQKIFIGAIFSLFICLVAFSSDSHATNIDYQYGSLTIQGRICKWTSNTINGVVFEPWFNCSQSVGLTVSTQFDNPTLPRQYFSLKGNAMGDLITAYNSSINCTSSSTRCYFLISRLIYSPKSSANDYVYLQNNDYYLYRFSTRYNVYMGYGYNFSYLSDTNFDLRYNFGGLDSYLNFNMQGQYSCLDQANNPCAVSYRNNHALDDLNDVGDYYSLMTSGKVVDITAYNYEFINNSYDSNSHSYDRSAYDGILYMIPLTNKNTFNSSGYLVLDGYIYFSQTDSFVEINDSGINPDDNPEWDIIEDNISGANNSNDSLLGINFSVINPFHNIFAGFSDNNCHTFSVIPSWFSMSSMQICSPWNSNLRNALSPVVAVLLNSISFGFIIHWLKNKYGGSE